MARMIEIFISHVQVNEKVIWEVIQRQEWPRWVRVDAIVWRKVWPLSFWKTIWIKTLLNKETITSKEYLCMTNKSQGSLGNKVIRRGILKQIVITRCQDPRSMTQDIADVEWWRNTSDCKAHAQNCRGIRVFSEERATSFGISTLVRVAARC